MNDDADLKAALATTEEARDRWHQKYTVEAQARKDETQVLGDALTALRQRHAEAAEKAYREGFEAAVEWSSVMCADKELVDTYWEESEAKKRIWREHDATRVGPH